MMKKETKIGLLTATSLVLIGCMLFAGVMSMLKWDFAKLSTIKYENNHYNVTETFHSIAVETNTADVTFVMSADGTCRVDCYEESNLKHTVSVQEDTLVIQLNDSRAWYDYININFGSPKITVHLPKADYTALSVRCDTGNVSLPKELRLEQVDVAVSTGDVNCLATASAAMAIKTSTGNIAVNDLSVGALELSASTGNITVSNVACAGDARVTVSTGETELTAVSCKNLTTSGNTGSITLTNVIAAEKLSITRSTGDVRFDGADAVEIQVKTDTGDVSGRLLTDKVFITKTSTGDVRVPNTTSGGKCTITTSTGDIHVRVDG